MLATSNLDEAADVIKAIHAQRARPYHPDLLNKGARVFVSTTVT
jgi:hypothetical protein